MSKSITVEIIAIGNEILIGDVQDTNTHWLCKEITGLGGHVRRGNLLRDDPQAIADEVRAALDRNTEVVFTTGGLGPTGDDLTLAAVAQGIDVAVRLHAQARQMVSDRYDELAAQGIVDQGGLNPAREKMAYLPEGAIPLHNPVGTAPAVLLKADQTTIICLPGVPAELKGIFTTSLQPFLRDTFGAGVFVERVVAAGCNDESLLAPVVSRIAAAHPDVYIKSRAKPFGKTAQHKITLSASGPDRAAVEALLDAALADLQAGLTAAGIPLNDPAIAA
jgi:molybdenum cofactor synthesis domain-containing protein